MTLPYDGSAWQTTTADTTSSATGGTISSTESSVILIWGAPQLATTDYDPIITDEAKTEEPELRQRPAWPIPESETWIMSPAEPNVRPLVVRPAEPIRGPPE